MTAETKVRIGGSLSLKRRLVIRRVFFAVRFSDSIVESGWELSAMGDKMVPVLFSCNYPTFNSVQ